MNLHQTYWNVLLWLPSVQLGIHISWRLSEEMERRVLKLLLYYAFNNLGCNVSFGSYNLVLHPVNSLYIFIVFYTYTMLFCSYPADTILFNFFWESSRSLSPTNGRFDLWIAEFTFYSNFVPQISRLYICGLYIVKVLQMTHS